MIDDKFKKIFQHLLSHKRITIAELQQLMRALKGKTDNLEKVFEIVTREYNEGYISEEDAIMFIDALPDDLKPSDVQQNNKFDYSDLSQVKVKYGISFP